MLPLVLWSTLAGAVEAPEPTGELLLRLPSGGRAAPGGAVDLPAANPALQALIVRYDLEVRPWLAVGEARVEALRARARARSGGSPPDLLAWVIARPGQGADLARLEADLRKAGIQDVAPYFALVPPPGDLEPTTPDFTSRQGYLGPDPGVDARAAWAWGVTGDGIRLSDCEYGWHPDHEDLMDGDLDPEEGLTVEPQVAARGWDDHGTAVAGEIIGQHNLYGVSGIAPDVTFAFYSEWTVERGYDRARAIFQAIEDSQPGDVVLLEMQTGGPDGRLAPAEVDPAVWTLVKTGVDAGVLVVGAAGNGAANLDSTAYESYRARGDSGAIVVGAGSSDTNHGRLGFSTYGARVNLQGWGQNVFTTGYGNHARYGAGDRQTYTASFSGTSSASPIVAAAAALVVEAIGQYRLAPPSPRIVRDVLVTSGRPGAPGANIGPLPDLAAALAEVERRFDVLPSVVVDVPSPIFEGDTVELAAAGVWLETLGARWAWTVEGAEIATTELASWTAPGDGTYAGQVTLTDDWGRSATEPFLLTALNLPPAAPSLTLQGDPVEGATLQVTASAVDPGGDPLTWRWTLDGVAQAEAGPTLTWTARQDGTARVEAVAVDDAGAASGPTTLEVVVQNVPPEVVIDGPDVLERGEVGSFFARVSDPGGDPFTATWEFGEGVRAYGPAAGYAWRARGPAVVTLTVFDGLDTVTVTKSIEVDRRSCGCAGDPTPATWLALAVGLLAGWARRRPSRR